MSEPEYAERLTQAMKNLARRQTKADYDALMNLADFMVEETLAMTDDEILDECQKNGEDIEEIAASVRAEIESVKLKLASPEKPA